LFFPRDTNTNMLKFIIVSDPNSGTIDRDPSLESRAFAIRLAFQIASDIKSINSFEQSGAASTVGGMVASAITFANGGAQTGAAVLAIQDTTAVATSLVAIAGSTSNSADNLVSNPSD
jgi:hypothetical protein